ncbi:MAG: chlorophyllase [Actinoplanes sp.]
MLRRTVALVLAASLTAACSAEPAAPPSPASPPPAASPSASVPAAPPAGSAPAATFAVQVRKLSLNRGADRPLPTTVWVPRGNGPFPLILFSHGLGALPTDYDELLRAWAKAGFVVAAPAYPHTSTGVKQFSVPDVLNQPADASLVITRVLAELGGQIDAERVAASGHSAGAVTTLGMFTGKRDDRLDAGMVLAGRQALPAPFTGTPVPMFFVHGRQDATVTFADGRAAYNAVPWPKAFLNLPKGGHVVAGNELKVVITTSTDFWQWTLYGDAAAKQRLGTDATRGGLATFVDSLG